MIYSLQEDLPGSCGVAVAFDFSYYGPVKYEYRKSLTKESGTPGGAGIITALFVVGDELSEKAFGQMCKEFTLEYHTAPRKNVNSGNEVFFAVFTTDENIGWHAYENT